MSVGDVDSTHEHEPADERRPAPEPPPAARWPRLARMPPLAMLSALAALTHAVVARLCLPLLGDGRIELLRVLQAAARYALNLSACAGMVALTIGALDIVVARDLTYVSRRVVLAVLAGMLVCTLALATFLPNGTIGPQSQVVLLAAGALHVYVVQLMLATMRAETSLAGRTTVALVALASLFPLASLLVRHTEPMSHWAWAQAGVASLHALGELAFLLVPIAAAFVVLPWSDDVSGRAARRAGTLAVCGMAVLFGAAARIPNALYGHVMYSALRLEWALERASLGYAVPISLAVGAATAAVVSRDSRHRQGGAALWLWLAGGYNPLTPARVFMSALAATLVCRAILGVGAEASKKS